MDAPLKPSDDRPRWLPGPLRSALQASDERFRDLIEAGADGVLVVRIDGTIGFANAAACALMGREPENLVGQPFGVPVVPGETTELDVPRIDGSVRFAEMRTAKTTWQGEPAYLAALRDVTDRKHAEAQRESHLFQERQRTEQLRKLAKVSTRLSAAQDVGSLLKIITEEARLLIGAHRAITRLLDGSSASDSATFVSLSSEFQTRGDLGENPDDGLSAPLVGRSGKTIGVVRISDKERGAFSEDDDAILSQLAQLAAVAVESARLYQELRENDRRKDEFLAMLAHELRNPLAAVSNALTLLRISEEAEDKQWANEVLDRQLQQLRGLIDDLLDVSRITTGKIRLKRERIEASPVLEHAVDSVRPIIDDRKHTLIQDIERGSLDLEVDATRLEQVVVNLLTNAAKYSESGSTIWLSARRRGDEIEIRVRDTGVGIPPEQLSRMFDLFAQGDRTLARSEGGLGIGLTIVRRLVELQGGSIEATSEGIGMGSEFIVRLPAAAHLASMGPEPRENPARSARVLLVDDDRETVQGISRLLEILGHEVRIVHEGRAALRLAESFDPSVILIDIGLPEMDGFEVVKTLRDRQASRKVPLLIALSEYGRDDDQRRSRDAGFDFHLVKPLDQETLMSILAGRR